MTSFHFKTTRPSGKTLEECMGLGDDAASKVVQQFFNPHATTSPSPWFTTGIPIPAQPAANSTGAGSPLGQVTGTGIIPSKREEHLRDLFLLSQLFQASYELRNGMDEYSRKAEDFRLTTFCAKMKELIEKILTEPIAEPVDVFSKIEKLRLEFGMAIPEFLEKMRIELNRKVPSVSMYKHWEERALRGKLKLAPVVEDLLLQYLKFHQKVPY